ncbi:MAG TPA: RES family NAD+ phosphorylase [Rhodothermales bacterium]|nr:RES family NAD+ phosphorylase [Rhodothermales bacterium]
MRVWRLVHARHAADAFSGEGAARFGGRFNSPGVAVVYTSGSLSLAMLELIVQVGSPRRLLDFVYLTADFDSGLVEHLEEPLPSGWDALPHHSVGQKLGDRWIGEGRSAVLRVPSVVVTGEFNYLINPHHPDSAAIEISEPSRAPFDVRITRGSGVRSAESGEGKSEPW